MNKKELKERINNILAQETIGLSNHFAIKYLDDMHREYQNDINKLIEHYNQTIREIVECWHGKIEIHRMSTYDLVKSIENVIQQRLPGFDAYKSNHKVNRGN